MLANSVWGLVFGMPQIAVIMGCLIPITAIVGGFWYRAQKVRFENELKRTMVERGMSADEIERIISVQRKDCPIP